MKHTKVMFSSPLASKTEIISCIDICNTQSRAKLYNLSLVHRAAIPRAIVNIRSVSTPLSAGNVLCCKDIIKFVTRQIIKLASEFVNSKWELASR